MFGKWIEIAFNSCLCQQLLKCFIFKIATSNDLCGEVKACKISTIETIKRMSMVHLRERIL